MSEEFEKFFSKFPKCKKCQDLQAKIDEQEKELEALRGFAIRNYECYYDTDKLMIEFGLMDDKGKPTKLLTGK